MKKPATITDGPGGRGLELMPKDFCDFRHHDLFKNKAGSNGVSGVNWVANPDHGSIGVGADCGSVRVVFEPVVGPVGMD